MYKLFYVFFYPADVSRLKYLFVIIDIIALNGMKKLNKTISCFINMNVKARKNCFFNEFLKKRK